MHRLKQKAVSHIVRAVLALACCSLFACAHQKPVVQDQLVVEQLRLRITKVRHAVAETRAVISSSRGAPYLPELHMRLAELLSEEARYHYMVAYEREQRSTKALHVPQVRFLKEKAISTYESILTRFPDSTLGDRILFNISHEYRELGEFDKMKGALNKLIKNYPDSAYRGEALLVLGDFYFDKMKFGRSQQYYLDIIKLKQGPLLGLSYYKLAWVDVNVGNCKQALNHFEGAIKAARKAEQEGHKRKKKKRKKLGAQLKGKFAIPEPEEGGHSFAGHKSVDVQREALVDLTYCYAQERKPDKAVKYLKGLAHTREAYVAALSKMANRYALIEQPRGAAEVSRELLRLAPDEEDRLDDARLLHTAVTRMKDYSMVGEDVQLIMKVVRRHLLRPQLKKSAGDLLRNEFELVVRDLATKSHEVLMNKDVKGSAWSKHTVSAEQIALAYRAYLDAVPNSKYKLEVLQNLSDVLMEGKQFLNAGHRYRQVAKLLEKDPPRKDPVSVKGKKEPAVEIDPKVAREQRLKLRFGALYSAVVAYQATLESDATRSHFERASARAGLRNAGGQYLAVGVEDKERAKKIKFAIAQSYYDEGNYLKAIDLLTAVAYEYPVDEQGKAAVHMVLDSYRTINDISGLINVGRRFIATGSPFGQDIKAQVTPIVAAAEQNRLDELSLAASGEQVGGMEVLLAFAERYKDTDLGERAMLSAFIAARAGGNTSQLYSLGEQVIKRFPSSDQVGGVVSTMGRAAASRFEFDLAIRYLEQAASLNSEQRGGLLIAAGELREQLADTKGASRNYRDALRASGEVAARADAAAHLASLIEREEPASSVVKLLRPLCDPPDPEVSSRLGLALLSTGKVDESEEHFRIVVESSIAATPSAQARANYGMAEVMLKMLEDYQAPREIDAIEELIGIVDVVLQSYLAAARQADPVFSQAALARMARAAEIAADKLDNVKLPNELSEEERNLVKTAMSNRAAQLRNDRNDILAECAQRARSSFLLDEAGRACINNTAPVEDPVRFHALSTRVKVKVSGVEAARDRLSKKPDDLEALREVGQAYLDAGDAHGARLVLGRIIEAGGGSDDLNLLGVACYQAGDLMGALDAFRRAKETGSGAAVRNLATICKELGMKKFAQELMEDAPSKGSGRLLKGGGR